MTFCESGIKGSIHVSLKSLIFYVMINKFCWQSERKSRRPPHFVHQKMGIIRFLKLLLFEQYGVKILIFSLGDTQNNSILLNINGQTRSLHIAFYRAVKLTVITGNVAINLFFMLRINDVNSFSPHSCKRERKKEKQKPQNKSQKTKQNKTKTKNKKQNKTQKTKTKTKTNQNINKQTKIIK